MYLVKDLAVFILYLLQSPRAFGKEDVWPCREVHIEVVSETIGIAENSNG